MTLGRCPFSIVWFRGTPPIGFGDSGARVGACMGRELYSRLGLLVREVGSNPPRNFDCFQGGSRKHLRARFKDGSRPFFNPHNKCLGPWRFPAVWSYGLFADERLRGLILALAHVANLPCNLAWFICSARIPPPLKTLQGPSLKLIFIFSSGITPKVSSLSLSCPDIRAMRTP